MSQHDKGDGALSFADAASQLPSARSLDADAPDPARAVHATASGGDPEALAAASAALPDGTRPPSTPPPRIDLSTLKPLALDDDSPRIRDDGRGFDESIRECLLLPLRGLAVLYLLMVGGAFTIAALLILAATLFEFIPSFFWQILALIGKIVGVLVIGGAVSLLQRIATIGLYASIQGLREMPFERRIQLTPIDGVVLTFVLMLLFLPVRAASIALPEPFGLAAGGVLLALPALLWPALIFVTLKSDDAGAAFDVAAIRRTIELCGRRYLMLVGLTWASASVGLIVWIGIGFVLPDSPFGIFAAALLAGVPIGWAHGVMGALFGRLIRDVPALGLPEIRFVDDD